jgi:hypothetical protein
MTSAPISTGVCSGSRSYEGAVPSGQGPGQLVGQYRRGEAARDAWDGTSVVPG